MKIDESKFLEPTDKYIIKTKLNKPKLWFNIDLIFMAQRYKDLKADEKHEAYLAYSMWLKEMGVEYGFDEIYERFKSYPKKHFDKLFKIVLNTMKL